MTISGVVTHGPTSSAEEMDTVASFFPGRSEVVRDPTKDQLLQCFGRSSLQHVIAHGSFRADNPEFSLLSAADGPLYVLDLFETRRKFELVVLSACSSGETGTGLGEEFSGVAHGFLRNGARALISSLWPIEDASATRLVREFYRSYTSDRPDPVEARAEAARAVRAEWNHPYYWSSFCVHGG